MILFTNLTPPYTCASPRSGYCYFCFKEFEIHVADVHIGCLNIIFNSFIDNIKKTEKYQSVPKSNRKIVQIGKIDTIHTYT